MKKSSLQWALCWFMFFSLLTFGNDKSSFKGDREMSITSVEHRDSGKPYRVEGQTSNFKPMLYYKLACGTGAADLEVGHVYPAQEITIEGTKSLVIGNIGSDAIVIACDIESVKDH